MRNIEDTHTWFACRMTEECMESMRNQGMKVTQMDKSICEAENRTRIWHYTNVESLLKIFSTKSFRFSRIDKVNDLMEKERLMEYELYKNVFLACFCHDEEESIPLWQIYTQKDNGVRIEFVFKESHIHSNMFHNNQVNQGIFNGLAIYDVIYTERIDDYFPTDNAGGELSIYPDHMAICKTPSWAYEKETRLVFLQKDITDDEEYLLLPINFDSVKHITITYGPWMPEEIKKSVELAVGYYAKDFIDKIEFVDSQMQGKIIRKG